MTDFKNGQELLEVCKKKQCSISEVMKQREIEGTSSTKKEVEDKMRKALAIMKEAVRKPLEDPKPSMSGLIGGEAKQITGYRESGTNVCGTFMNKLIAYSMAVLEVNASMGVIVAAPTAGSSGVVPGVLLALQEEKGFSDEQMTDALFHTAAIGYLLMNLFSTSSNLSGDVCSTLFGSTSILTLTKSEVWLCAVLSVAVVAVFVLCYNKIFAVTFDENFAKAVGTKADLYNLLIAVTIAVVIVLAMNLVGSLLISALVVFPALSAMRVCKNFRAVTICAAVLSVCCAALGILISILAGTPVGSTIVAVDIFAFLFLSGISRLGGIRR